MQKKIICIYHRLMGPKLKKKIHIQHIKHKKRKKKYIGAKLYVKLIGARLKKIYLHFT